MTFPIYSPIHGVRVSKNTTPPLQIISTILKSGLHICEGSSCTTLKTVVDMAKDPILVV